MSIFNNLKNSPQKPNIDMNQMNQLMGQFRQNPIGFLQSMGYNIPSNINTPDGIINYLMQSNQINGGLLSAAQMMFGNLFKR